MCKTQEAFIAQLDKLNLELANLIEKVRTEHGKNYIGLDSFSKEQREQRKIIRAKIDILFASHTIDDAKKYKMDKESYARADEDLKAEKQ